MTVGYLPNTATWGNASHEPPQGWTSGHLRSGLPACRRRHSATDHRRHPSPGAPIPSRAQLTRKYQVGETAARHALRVLAGEGLIIGRVGSGHYVRERPDLTALHRWRFLDHPAPPSRPTCNRRADA
ncbi:GntR family transcriptional regulator [Nonomuraea salmonea]|uniref:GntR family transcriptional regulator n=1 Tax=Nonomuraea salmonea TaxID=46181 RepID=UPI0031EF5D78